MQPCNKADVDQGERAAADRPLRDEPPQHGAADQGREEVGRGRLQVYGEQQQRARSRRRTDRRPVYVVWRLRVVRCTLSVWLLRVVQCTLSVCHLRVVRQLLPPPTP